MKMEEIRKAVSDVSWTNPAFIATTDLDGVPHITCAGKLAIENENVLSVTEWFCPGTVANLRRNPNISVAVLDKDTDGGFQFIGMLEKISDVGILDGYAAAVEGKYPIPQVEKQLVVRVKKIMDFSLKPHTDIEEKVNE